jgi:hypothetical protein
MLVVEGVGAIDGQPLGTDVFNYEPGMALLPDFQLIASNPLGDGSADVCDGGGVPATAPFEFADTPAASATINDLTCRANALMGSTSCVRDGATRQEVFASGFQPDRQFCLPVGRNFAFPEGNTFVTVRLRLADGVTYTEPAVLVLRVEPQF